MTMIVFAFPILTVFVSITMTYILTVFDHLSKYVKVCQKHTNTYCIFTSFLSIWKCGLTQSFVSDILFLNAFHLSGSRIHHLLGIINLPSNKELHNFITKLCIY